MSSHAETPKPTQLYSKLSTDQQAEFGKVVIEKLRTLIGGYGELSVLAEYIVVMLQSSRPPEQIQSELEAFLQDQSQPFTDWLCKQLAKHAGESGPPADAKGEALLLRAVQDARQGAAAAEGAASGKRREKAAEREQRERRPSRNRHRSENHRSRSRPRRRRERAAAAGTAGSHRREGSRAPPQDLANGGSAASRSAAEDRKAVLTPNVQFLRDAYHQKGLTVEEPAGREPASSSQAETAPPPADTRWHFRAEPAAPALPASWQAAEHGGHPALGHAALGPYGHPAAYGWPPGGPPGGPHLALADSAPASSAPVRPRHFAPKKWKVARPNTVVRATEHLNSEEVQMLQEGEIVEQVAPAFKLKNGIIRIQIRHPSSPQFPNPIGWVTQDATAAGGPKFLEPGPEPMQKGWRPPAVSAAAPPWVSQAASWRPRGPLGSPGKGSPVRAPGPYGFQNLTWTPSNARSPAGSEPIAV